MQINECHHVYGPLSPSSSPPPPPPLLPPPPPSFSPQPAHTQQYLLLTLYSQECPATQKLSTRMVSVCMEFVACLFMISKRGIVCLCVTWLWTLQCGVVWIKVGYTYLHGIQTNTHLCVRISHSIPVEYV